MKSLIFSAFLLFSSAFVWAQDLDELDDSFIAERNKSLLKADVKEPFLQIKPQKCTNFKEISINEGATAFKERLTKYMYSYLNADYYTLSGDFTFTLTVDETGKVTKVESAPKVQNSELFFEDMKYIFRRMKLQWAPATCLDKPIKSELKIKISYSSVNIDS